MQSIYTNFDEITLTHLHPPRQHPSSPPVLSEPHSALAHCSRYSTDLPPPEHKSRSGPARRMDLWVLVELPVFDERTSV